MKGFWHSPIALLVITGVLLGLSLPFGKLGTEAGASAALWSFVISFGAGATLLLAMLLRGQAPGLDAHRLRYYLVAAAISYAIPNIIAFAAIPHVGAGYVGITFTLSPVFTLGLSLLLRQARPSLLGIAGIAVGFVGAMIVAVTRGSLGAGPEGLFWPAIALLVPVFLALGNVYRTLDWPAGAGSTELAAGSHLACALMLGAGLLATGTLDLALLAENAPLVGAQMAAAAAMFAFFFRLQHVGGPVYLSQIGYVAAGVGLASGTLFLGERYGLLTWAGAVVILLGVALTTKAQRRAARAKRRHAS